MTSSFIDMPLPRAAHVRHVTRVAHVAHLIETSGPGGAERMVADLARAQRARGVRVTVFLPTHGEAWLAEQLAGSGVDIEYAVLRGPFAPRSVWSLGGALRRCGVTHAHSHDFTMAVNGACAARAAGIPHLITMHGGRYYQGRLRRRVALRLAVAGSARTCAVSARLAAQLCDDLHLPSARIDVVPNGVAPRAAAASTLRRELALPDGVPLLVAVGNLYPVKAHRLIVAALARIPTDAHLVIAGRGECEREVRELATRLGLEARLHLLGLRADVANVLGAADVFVLPSLSEGLPVALLEAMLAGCPIVASDVGDIRRAVGDDGAVLVAAGDTDGLAAAIERLLLDPDLARSLGRAARARALTAYGLETMVDRYATLYRPLA